MKKIYALTLLLALLAVLAVPMAASANTVVNSVTVGGSITVGSIAMSPPGAIAFGTLSLINPNEKNAAPGSVTVTPGSSGATAWTASAQAATSLRTGSMMSGSNYLQTKLQIGKSVAENTWIPADTVLSYSGSAATGPIPFAAKQTLLASDNNAIYSITITFTASFTG